MKTTAAMVQMLIGLDRQERAADAYPGAYSAGLFVGGTCAHKSTCEALGRRGMVTESERWGLRQIDLTAAGRLAIRDAGAMLLCVCDF